MIFVIEFYIGRQMVHEKGANSFIIGILVYKIVPHEGPYRIDVHYKTRKLSCVKQDTVRSFRAYAFNIKKYWP